ncbi:MAG TPA: protein kinase [Candidatus Angelobacter sp.]|jgi:serine/threonine protein kinase/Flp pilus assembly protein TadD|nr:protein kinase [Candidatus Angelobacter sp.]
MTSDNWSQEDLKLIMSVYYLVRKLPHQERSSALDRLLPGSTFHRQAVEQLLAGNLKGDSICSLISDEVSSDSQSVKQSVSKSELRTGEVLAGRFEIVERLGHGGMAYVYEAKDKKRRCRVALKVVRRTVGGEASAGNDFGSIVKEVNISLQVAHRNVCRVFDIGQHVREDGQVNFLTMELLPGETLSARLNRTGRLDTAEAAEIARQLCEALQAAHDAEVLHRDFKCSNIMLINSGRDVRAVVTDFGIACWTQPEHYLTDSGRSAETIQGIAGTPVYMSPEQLRRHKLTEASDIYSLGLVLYEMVTGRRPFQRDSDDSPQLEPNRRLTEDPQPPAKVVPGLGENWNKSILRCLERDPAKRFPSARAVWEGLNPPPAKPLLLKIAAVVASILLVIALSQSQALQILLNPLPQQKNIAVLPFRLASTNPDDQAFSYGFMKSATEFLSQCCSSERVWVVPFSRVRGQHNTSAHENAKHPASALGVNLLVTGELGNAQGVLQLSIEVKDAKTFKILRSRVVKIPDGQVAALEDQMLEQLAEMLELKIPSGHKRPVGYTANSRAYELWQQGRGYLAQQQNLQDLDQAITKLEQAVQMDNNFAVAFADLGDAYYRKYSYTGLLKWLDKAEEASSRSIPINGKLSQVYVTLGKISQKKGYWRSAISEFEQAHNLDPASDDTRCLLATAYYEHNQQPKAESLLHDAINHNPESWTSYDCLGVLYYHSSRYRDAEPLLLTATRLAPGNPIAHQLGGLYLAQGKFKEAAEIETEAIKTTPTYAAHSNLGTARFYLKEYDAAVESFTEATHLRSGDHRLWRNLGDADTLAGNLAEALADYHRAIQELNKDLKVNPNDCSKLEFLSLYFAKLGEKRHAMQTLTQAKCRPGNDPELIFNLVLIYELIGQRNQALAELGSAVEAGYSRQEIQNAFELEQMRKDKRYQEIMDKGNSRKLV